MRNLILLIIVLSMISTPTVQAHMEVTPISLTLTISTDGTTKVDYYTSCDPTQVRVSTELFGANIKNLIVRDEDGNPLEAKILEDIVQIDCIGAIELYFTYQTNTLTQENDFIWVANVTSPVNVTFILPKNADLFDLSEVPQEIGEIGESPYLQFGPGSQYVYYILGLPSVVQEANASLTRASDFLTEKDTEGYILSGAVELLLEANSLFKSEKYLEAKNKAAEAVNIALDIIEFADTANFAIQSAEASINEAKSQGRTIGLESAESTLDEAINLFDSGLYRDAKMVALQAAEEAHDAEKPVQNNLIYIGTGATLLIIVLWFGRKRLRF